MVAGLSRKKKSQAAHAEQLSEAVSEFGAASRFLAEAIDRDAASFESVMAAYKLPQGNPGEQQAPRRCHPASVKGAAQVPLEVARQAAKLFEKLGQLEAMSSPSMLSDIRVARLMAVAAVQGALANVAINLESIADAEFAGRINRKPNAESAHTGTARPRRKIVNKSLILGG